jgi:hypothetical protein
MHALPVLVWLGLTYACVCVCVCVCMGDFVCDAVGYKCVGNNAYPEPCAEGTYQDEMGRTMCKTCKAGSYCPGTVGAKSDRNVTLPSICAAPTNGT